MWGLPQKQNARRADKIRLCGHLRRYKKIVKKTYIIYNRNISFEQNGITISPSGWNVWTSDSSDENTVRTEYGDAYDGDYKLTFWDDKEYSCSVYKTYTNIPNGTYKFSIWAKTNGKQDVLQLYAKNYGGSELDTTIETSDINWNIFSIDKIVVTNHTLEIGVYSVAGANDWCNLDLAMLRKID